MKRSKNSVSRNIAGSGLLFIAVAALVLIWDVRCWPLSTPFQIQAHRINLSHSLHLSAMPRSGYMLPQFDRSILLDSRINMPSSGLRLLETKINNMERYLIPAQEFKSYLEPRIAEFNRGSISQKVDMLYGNMQLSDVVKYDISEIENIMDVAEKNLGMGFVLADNIKKYRDDTGLTDKYLLKNYGISGAEVSAIELITLEDFKKAVEVIKENGEEWQRSDSFQRKQILMGLLIKFASERYNKIGYLPIKGPTYWFERWGTYETETLCA